MNREESTLIFTGSPTESFGQTVIPAIVKTTDNQNVCFWCEKQLWHFLWVDPRHVSTEQGNHFQSGNGHHVKQHVDFDIEPVCLFLAELVHPIRGQVAESVAASNERARQTRAHAAVPANHRQLRDGLSTT